jgi:SAM-dependent methyltransferase
LEYSYVIPPLPGFRRWRRLFRDFAGNSEIRVLEYELLAKQKIAGRVLDVGGGEKSRTRSYLPQGLNPDSVNIDPAIEPTHLIKPGDGFPMASNTYDGAVCLNTLEHVYDAKGILAETRRVLKPGGTLYVTVPFMFRIHAHPDGYFRGTPSWWRQALEDTGYSKVELTPLVWAAMLRQG